MDGWKADDHEFGRGKVHWIKDKPDGQWDDYEPARRKKLLCGRWLDATPGKPISDPHPDAITCGGCMNKKISLDEAPFQEEQRRKQQIAWEANRIQEQQAWREQRFAELRERYARWDWDLLRKKVLSRDNHQCQGCGGARATTVHHLTYDRLGSEMLFDLISVCSQCHAKIHPHIEEQR